MNPHRILLSIAPLFLAATTSFALDTIKTTSGTTVSGKNIQVHWDHVEIEIGSEGTAKNVPANQILWIFFQGEPGSLKNAKQALITDRNYREALTALGKIKPDSLGSNEVKQEHDFYTALATSKLALAGTGSIQEAGKLMRDFVKNNPESFHLLEAQEILGDLFVAVRSFAKAEEAYGKLASAPWPDIKMKGNLLIGRAQLAQNKFDEADQSFQTVLDNLAANSSTESLRLQASVGKAAVLVGKKKSKEAIAMIRDLIDRNDSGNAELMARAYNVLGNAYRQMNDLQEAKLAFLHTDQLYSSVPDAHAEALANLAEIWEQLRKTDRAVEARKTLDRLYKNSPWTKRSDR